MTRKERRKLQTALDAYYNKLSIPGIDQRNLDEEREAGYDLSAAVAEVLREEIS
jgi:hypothetical protein